jgi:hypothetical protein
MRRKLTSVSALWLFLLSCLGRRAFGSEALGEKKVTPLPTVALGAQATSPG